MVDGSAADGGVAAFGMILLHLAGQGRRLTVGGDGVKDGAGAGGGPQGARALCRGRKGLQSWGDSLVDSLIIMDAVATANRLNRL